MKEDILILTASRNDVTYSKDAGVYGIPVDTIFNKKNLLIKIFCRIDRVLETNFASLFFKKWKNNLSQYHDVIILAQPDSVQVTKYINHYYPEINVRIWYNNIVEKEVNPSKFKKTSGILYSFDRNDSEKYNLHYVNQYIDLTPIEEVKNSYTDRDYLYDIAFIGRSKGRLPQLLAYKKLFDEANFNTFYHIVISGEDRFEKNYSFQKELSYKEMLTLQSKARIILDILQDGQYGITLRPLEALFMKKKLITNNRNICNEDFYNSNNIFVLTDKTTPLQLIEFMKRDFEEIPVEVTKKYTFKGWIDCITE
ncbi:hypothetical protein [Latilactobacillus curvatus]